MVEICHQHGALTDQTGRLTRVASWTGIDPAINEETITQNGCVLRPGRPSALDFPDSTFDVALFANVFEHVPPDERDVSLREIYRVPSRQASLWAGFQTLVSRSSPTFGCRSWIGRR